MKIKIQGHICPMCKNVGVDEFKGKFYCRKHLNRIVPCQICGELFVGKTVSNTKYCDKCRESVTYEEEYKAEKRSLHIKICPHCAKEFQFNATEKQSHLRIYCSKECLNQSVYDKTIRRGWFIFERDNFTCFYCGRTSYKDHIELRIDHVFPYSLGGKSVAGNLVTSCNECNSAKSNRVMSSIENILKEIARRNEESGINSNVPIKLSGKDGN
jgi:5-methylcytosine-specific restriction endonuclease McrA